MARTVDTSSTFENWRQNYNDLATDVGPLGNLTTGDKTSLVSAVNFIMDQYFFFQDCKLLFVQSNRDHTLIIQRQLFELLLL